MPRSDIPQHLLNLPALFVENLISPESFKDLNDLMREMEVFPSNVDDLRSIGFTPLHEHIGEAQPIGADGKCSHKYLAPNINRTHCILPQRIDIGKHFITTGGIRLFLVSYCIYLRFLIDLILTCVIIFYYSFICAYLYSGPDAIREPFEKMINRVSSFGRYMFETVEKYPIVVKLFQQDKFQKAAKSICPAEKQFLDPFQFNFIMQVPGQTVATHIDGAYFWGATRKDVPQWLLACMGFSGLFQDKFVDQVRTVGYPHHYHHYDDGAECRQCYWPYVPVIVMT